MNDKRNRKITHKDFYDSRYKDEKPFRGLLEVSKRIKLMRVIRDIRSLVPAGNDVIDVGCGRGRTASALSRWYRVSACDSASDTMRINQNRMPEINFFTQDVTSEALDPKLIGAFAAATCIDVIEHVPFEMQKNAVRKLAEMLAPGGVLILTTPDREVSLTFKRDAAISDEEFLRMREQQPRADQLVAEELDTLLNVEFSLIYSGNLVPAIHYRPTDLLWKALFLPVRYRGVEWLRELLRIRGQYHYRIVQKR